MTNIKAYIIFLGLIIVSCQKEDISSLSDAESQVSNSSNLTAKTVAGNVPSHDPSTIVKSGVNYYVFTTGDNIPMTYSRDLINWTWGTSVFTSTPSWITSYVPGFTKNFWAPDVAWFNNRWNMYYSCSTFGSATSAIGLVTTPAISQSAGTTWTDRGRVVSSTSASDVNAIDPSILVDGSNVYMAYGSWHAGIGVVQINPSTGLPTGTRTIVAGGNSASWEGPCMIKEGSYYYMFVNRGNCCQGVNSTYYIVVGRSTNPFGPYVDKNGVALTAGGGTKHKVYHTALRILQSTGHAEDVLQEVFMKIWLGREKLPEVNCFGAYLNTITRNHIYNALRKLASEELLLEKLLSPQLAADRPDAALENMSLRELQDALQKVMATLTPQQKKVFELSRMEGLKHEEIALRLNISRETVKKHVSEALRIIRGQLQRYIQLPQFSLLLFFFISS